MMLFLIRVLFVTIGYALNLLEANKNRKTLEPQLQSSLTRTDSQNMMMMSYVT